jgi:hypothetical protein
VAVATNEFELYTDSGVQMKARSPAVQTFVIQLSGPGSYLLTARATTSSATGPRCLWPRSTRRDSA